MRLTGRFREGTGPSRVKRPEPVAMTNAFFVHIVESPAPSDLFDGRTEGNTLASFLNLAGIPNCYSLAVDHEHFSKALGERLTQAIGYCGLPPIIHISAHGNDMGIQLTDQRKDGGILKWEQLREIIKPVHQGMNGVGVCLSTCGGAFGRRMAEVITAEEIPMAWVAGAGGKISYSDAALGFAVFYRSLQRGLSDADIVSAVRAASGTSDFEVHFASQVQQEFVRQLIDFLNKWQHERSAPRASLGLGALAARSNAFEPTVPIGPTWPNGTPP